MTNNPLRVLYLSNAFPPGVSGRFPAANPAGHATETRFAQALGKRVRLSTVGLLPDVVYGRLEPRDDSLGLEHEMVIWDRRPELWHRWLCWRQLRRYYLDKVAKEGPPDVVLVRNLYPAFNHFIRWLRRQPKRPLTVLVLADSGTLGQKAAVWRRFRYAFKPMQTWDDKAILWYDACISFGIGTRPYFESRGAPWMWMPSAYNFLYEPPREAPHGGPIRFGYFGALMEHAAVVPMVRLFSEAGIPGTLHMCGYGKLAGQLRDLASQHPNFHFDGTLPTQADCLSWAQKVDVLVNPRLLHWGLENSFPSKIFEYAMTGKAILSSRLGGVDEVLKEDGFYLDIDQKFEDSFRHSVREIAAMDRAELQRRGTSIRNRVLKEFNWDAQAGRMVEFMQGALGRPGPWRK